MRRPGPARRTARLAVIVLACSVPGLAGAQTTTPFSGLFGRTPERVGKEFTALEFRASSSGEYDNGLFLESGPSAGDALDGGFSAGTDAALAFGRKTTRSNIVMAGRALYKEYFSDIPFGATSYDASLALARNVTTRFSVNTEGYFARSPFFHMLPPSLTERQDWVVPVAAQPFAARLLTNDIYDARVGASYQTSKRSTLSVYGVGREVRFPKEPQHGYDMLGGEGGWKHRVSRDLSVHLLYGREEFRLRDAAASRYLHEYLDIGVDFARELSLARRTTLSFTTQTAMLREANAPRKYRVNGNVTLTKWFQRTWHASVIAQRSTDFLPGFFKPLFSDTVNTSVGGMLSTRVNWYLIAGGGSGNFGSDAPQRFRTATAVTRLNVGLTQRLGLYTQYSLYYYDDLPAGSSAIPLASELTRQTVSMGLNLWVPLISKVTVPRGPQ